MSENASLNGVSDGFDLNENPRVCQAMAETLTKPSLDQGSAEDSGSERPIEADIGEVKVCSEGYDQKVCQGQIEALFGDSNSLVGDGDASAVSSNVSEVDGNSSKEAGTMDSVKYSRNNEIESVVGQRLNVSVDDQRTGRKSESARGEDQETRSSVEEAADLRKIDVAEVIPCIGGGGGTMKIDVVGAGESMVSASSAKQIGNVEADSVLRDGDHDGKYTLTVAFVSTVDVYSAERIEVPVLDVAKQIEGSGVAKQIQVLEEGLAKEVKVLEQIEEQIEVLEEGAAKQIAVSEGVLTKRTNILEESGTKKVEVLKETVDEQIEVLEEGIMQVETTNECFTSSQEVHVTRDHSVSDKKHGSAVEVVDLDSSKGTKVVEVVSSGSVKDQATGIEWIGASSSAPKDANNAGASCGDEDSSIVLPSEDGNTEKSQNIGTQKACALTTEIQSLLPWEQKKMVDQVTAGSSSLQIGDREIDTLLLDENLDTDALVGLVCSSVPYGAQNSDAEVTESSTSQPDSGAEARGSSAFLPGEDQQSSAQITEISITGHIGEAFPVSEPDTSENAGAQDTKICVPVLGEDQITCGQVLESGIRPPDGNQTVGNCVMELGVLPLHVEQSVQTQSTSSLPDAGARSQVSNVGISLPNGYQNGVNLVIDLGTSRVDENPNTGDGLVKIIENQALEIEVTKMRTKGDFSFSVENHSTGTEATDMVNDGNQMAGIETPIYAGKDVGNPDLVEQTTADLDIQDLSKREEKKNEEVARPDGEKSGTVSVEKEICVCCSQSQEDQFSSADLVWGKVKSHPWWPGQIFDASDSSVKAKKYQKKDSFLVAYFGDRTFAWCEKSQLKPFRVNFAQMEKQSNSDAFLNAVDSALDEVTRRVEVGLACSCLPKSSFQSLKSQDVINAGIREGAIVAGSDDKSLTVTSFEHSILLGYINELAMYPSSGGVDRLELTIAQAQLTAYYRAKGYSKLPLFHVQRGLSENDGAEFSLAGRTCSENVVEHLTPIPVEKEQNSSRLVSKNGGVESRESPSRIWKHILDDSLYHSRKLKSLAELMAGNKAYGGRARAGNKGISNSFSPSVGAKKQKRTRGSFSSGSLRNMKKRHSLLSETSPTTRRYFKRASSSADSVRNRKRKRLASLSDADTRTPTTRRSLKEGSYSVDLAQDKKKKRCALPSDANTDIPTIQRSLNGNSISAVSVRNRKRKMLASLSDTNTHTLITRGSSKGGECISRIANQLTGSPLILKFSRESSRKNATKEKRTRSSNRTAGVGGVSPHLASSPPILRFSRESSRKNAIKVDRSRASDKTAGVGNISSQTPENRRKISIPKENSPNEMLSQLCLTARDPMKGCNFLSAIVCFFTGFRNLAYQNDSGSGSGKRKKSLEKMCLPNPKTHCAKTFKYDDVKDSYWTDRIIYSSPEEPLGESKLVSPTKKQDQQISCTESKLLRPAKMQDQQISCTESKLLRPAKKQDPQSTSNPSWKSANSPEFSSKSDPEQESGARKQVGNSGEGSSPTALILTFKEGDSLPSKKDLFNIFTRYGPLNESETEVLTMTNRARVIFKRRSDAEVAFSSAGKFSIFGPALVSYRLSKVSPAKPSLSKASPTGLSPAKASPAKKPSLSKASPTKLSPAKASPAKPSLSKASPTKLSPAKDSPTMPSLSKAFPTKLSPAKASPTKP